MNYSKPDMTVLGNATLVTQGSGSNKVDDPDHQVAADCELDG